MNGLFSVVNLTQSGLVFFARIWNLTSVGHLLFFAQTKRASGSNSLPCSLHKEQQEQLALLLFTKRTTWSDLLSRSLQKERKEPITLFCSSCSFVKSD